MYRTEGWPSSGANLALAAVWLAESSQVVLVLPDGGALGGGETGSQGMTAADLQCPKKLMALLAVFSRTGSSADAFVMCYIQADSESSLCRA